MKNIAIYGAGGFGREVACLIKHINRVSPTWKLIGFFDDCKETGYQTEYGDVLGNIDSLNHWNEPLSIVIAIGNPSTLKNVAQKINNSNISFPSLVSPDAILYDAENITLGRGNIITPQCIFTCAVEINDFNIFNCGVTVGHDAKIGSYNVLMPSVNISGGVKVGNENFFGLGAKVLQLVKIENEIRLGAGSVLMRNAKNKNLYMGNPATIVKF